MRCPNCRCEIGRQTICPYCGQVIQADPQRIYEMQTLQVQGSATQNMQNRIYRHVNNVETTSKLILILMVGLFVLQVLTLVVVMLK